MLLGKVQIQAQSDVDEMEEQRRQAENIEHNYQHEEVEALGGEAPQDQILTAPSVRNEPKVGRNEPCPCGSGKKYKQCHGKLT